MRLALRPVAGLVLRRDGHAVLGPGQQVAQHGGGGVAGGDHGLQPGAVPTLRVVGQPVAEHAARRR